MVTIVIQTVLAGSMDQIWTLQNSLKLLLAYQIINISYPGNVHDTLLYVSNIA
jgi:hypothetical protein